MNPNQLAFGPNGEIGFYDDNGNFVPMPNINPGQDQQFVQGIQNNLTGATVDQNAIPTAPIEQGAGLSQQQKGNLMGLGAQGVQLAGQMIGEDQYDYRVGMEKPNAIKTLTNTQFTQMGSAFGPVGAGIGAGVDIVKNIAAFMKQKRAYENAGNKATFNEFRNENAMFQQPDFTGQAAYGMEAKSYANGGGPGGNPFKGQKRFEKYVSKHAIPEWLINATANKYGYGNMTIPGSQPIPNADANATGQSSQGPMVLPNAMRLQQAPGGTELGGLSFQEAGAPTFSKMVKLLKKERQGAGNKLDVMASGIDTSGSQDASLGMGGGQVTGGSYSYGGQIILKKKKKK